MLIDIYFNFFFIKQLRCWGLIWLPRWRLMDHSLVWCLSALIAGCATKQLLFTSCSDLPHGSCFEQSLDVFSKLCSDSRRHYNCSNSLGQSFCHCQPQCTPNSKSFSSRPLWKFFPWWPSRRSIVGANTILYLHEGAWNDWCKTPLPLTPLLAT